MNLNKVLERLLFPIAFIGAGLFLFVKVLEQIIATPEFAGVFTQIQQQADPSKYMNELAWTISPLLFAAAVMPYILYIVLSKIIFKKKGACHE